MNEEFSKALEAAYLDRNLLLALLARFCSTNRWPTWTGPASDPEPGFSRVLFIETPEGQISYHYPDGLEPLFAPFPTRGAAWDGHSTETKRERLRGVIREFDAKLREVQESLRVERERKRS